MELVKTALLSEPYQAPWDRELWNRLTEVQSNSSLVPDPVVLSECVCVTWTVSDGNIQGHSHKG